MTKFVLIGANVGCLLRAIRGVSAKVLVAYYVIWVLIWKYNNNIYQLSKRYDCNFKDS